jgi:hypothetical protein
MTLPIQALPGAIHRLRDIRPGDLVIDHRLKTMIFIISIKLTTADGDVPKEEATHARYQYLYCCHAPNSSEHIEALEKKFSWDGARLDNVEYEILSRGKQ